MNIPRELCLICPSMQIVKFAKQNTQFSLKTSISLRKGINFQVRKKYRLKLKFSLNKLSKRTQVRGVDHKELAESVLIKNKGSSKAYKDG